MIHEAKRKETPSSTSICCGGKLRVVIEFYLSKEEQHANPCPKKEDHM
jgi:hypothetical protein